MPEACGSSGKGGDVVVDSDGQVNAQSGASSQSGCVQIILS
ncbi:hypothetical protein [Streptomyces sp. YIM 121038]|nr:hypothetical protein [Streptomyces sp. YIM 121038]